MSAHDPQAAAADPARSAWVAANAGTGKTYTLANRVTRLLLAGAKPERILCLTYTKAAAGEMAGRLFDQLGKWAMAPDNTLAKFISDIGASEYRGRDLRAARRLFAQALETPGGLKIQTIHSFCQTLLSRFPLEAGVPPGFSVLDEQTAREMMTSARAGILDQAGAGNPLLASALSTLVTHTSDMQLAQLLDSALMGGRHKLLQALDRLRDHDGSFTRALRRQHGAHEELDDSELVCNFCIALKAEIARLRDVIAWLQSGVKSDQARAGALSRALTLELGPESFEALRDAFFTAGGTVYKALATKPLATARGDLLAWLQQLCDHVCTTEEARRAAYAAKLADAALTLADAVHRRYAQAKRTRGVLDYDDLIHASAQLLSKRDAAAWVLYKLDGGLDHILVDEAQDTSEEQWAILRSLTEEFFAGEGRRSADAPPRTIFAVGDEKQSIFSFQGADPIQFDANRRYFEARVSEAGQIFAHEQLTTSRRSVPEVLHFVDGVFADEEARQGLTAEDSAIAHDPLRKDDTGRVEFWPSIPHPKGDEPDPWHPVDAPSEVSPVSVLADRLARQIASWIGKRVLPGHDKAVAAGDIMILLPRREPFGSEIIRHLKMQGVPVAGADRIAVTSQIAVMDLMALGRFVLLPEDELNLAALLRSPLVGLSEEELFALCHGRERRLWHALISRQNETAYKHAHAFLSGMRARADYAPPYEFYAHVLSAEGGRMKLLSRLGAEANDAIDEFLSLALTYENANTPSLEGFLQWLTRGEPEIRRDMERARDEVRVMTVHGAKGLEADIVILPDTTRAVPASREGLLFTDDGVLFSVPKAEAPPSVLAAKEVLKRRALEEHRRLLYVALTRARDVLYVCGFENKRGVAPDSWYAMARKAAHRLGTAITRDDETIHVLGGGEDAGVAAPVAAAKARTAIDEWVKQPAPAEAAGPRRVRPSQAAEYEPAMFSPRKTERFRRGNLVHAMLQRLPDVAPDRREELAQRFLRARGASKDESNALIAETLRVLDDPVFAAVFASGSRAEVGVAATLDSIAINGRIDRLAVTDTEVLIADYKTNRPPPKRVEDVPSSILVQMALYRAALARLYPKHTIACALVWTDGPRLMRLPELLLDAQFTRLQQ